ncbi:unnamed protein product [Prunus armeniaca]
MPNHFSASTVWRRLWETIENRPIFLQNTWDHFSANVLIGRWVAVRQAKQSKPSVAPMHALR